MYTIRLATKEDKHAIILLGYNFFQATPYAALKEKFSVDRAGRLADLYLGKPNEEAIALLLVHNEVPVGILAGIAIESLLTEGYTAVEQMWWVEPEHRGRDSLKLFKLFLEWAKHIGCSMVTMAGLTGMTEVDKLYKKNGFVLTETSYVKEL